jgi:phytoene dehydrogenase-like protein
MKALRGQYDAVIVGSGPNGLAAAITIAQAGRSVLVVEGRETIGGGTRTEELTLPGFFHDVCSTAYPVGAMSPFFRSLPLEKHGLEWVHPEIPLAHPLDDGTAAILDRSVEATAANLGEDGARYRKLMQPILDAWVELEPLLLGYSMIPKRPVAAARFGLLAMHSASKFARTKFGGQRARALFAGCAAHSILPLEKVPSAAFGLVFLAAGHQVGWPFARGGARKIADALASYLRSLGGEIVTATMVESLEQLPAARMTLCDVTPRQFARMGGTRFPCAFRGRLERFRYGPGVCKVDWALDGPIPWTAKECLRAGTVHLGGTLEEIEVSERAPWKQEICEKPFVLLTQPTLFDSTRAPAGGHIAWAYCHVPNGSGADITERIEAQVERFAPGFRQTVRKRSVLAAPQLEARNPNLVGGDVTGGSSDLRQFYLRPTWRGYRTPAKGLYICSASTFPGGGVHGICGHLAARTALRDMP